jgi:hypothetical protein
MSTITPRRPRRRLSAKTSWATETPLGAAGNPAKRLLRDDPSGRLSRSTGTPGRCGRWHQSEAARVHRVPPRGAGCRRGAPPRIARYDHGSGEHRDQLGHPARPRRDREPTGSTPAGSLPARCRGPDPGRGLERWRAPNRSPRCRPGAMPKRRLAWALGEEAFEYARAGGCALNRQEAVAYAAGDGDLDEPAREEGP